MSGVVHVGKNGIPFAPVDINLEEYIDRKSYSRKMIIDGMEVIRKNDRYDIKVNDSEYCLVVKKNCRAEFYHSWNILFDSYCDGSDVCGVLYKKVDVNEDTVVNIFFADDAFAYKSNPYKFHNKPIREERSKPKRFADRGEVLVEGNKEGEFYSYFWYSVLHGFIYGSTGRRYVDKFCSPSSYARDFSDVFDINNGCYFVGNRAQIIRLAIISAANDMDIDRVANYNKKLFNSLENLNSGVLPSHIIEGIRELNVIDFDGSTIPVINKIDDNKFVFYKHNFDRYKSNIRKKMIF